MNTCRTCIHWNPTPEDDWREIVNPVDPDTYEPMTDLPFEVRMCKHPKLLFCERPLESNGFAVADGSQYFAALYTAEDFGCVKWESNEGSPDGTVRQQD